MSAHTKNTWERSVPVFDAPLWSRPFLLLCGLAGLGLILVAYREIVGLGPASGMNDAYAWGIWKTFNTMVLTGLGSGAFAVGIAAWIFRREKLHVVMRTAVLTSFLAYIFGLAMLGVDVGRPWNFYWILAPWHWNLHSPLLEVAVCMSIYATVPLFLENIPPALEYLYDRWPSFRPGVKKAEKYYIAGLPWIVSLAYVLPAMHQSSLGALMLLGGTRVSPLWQTPFLPLLYVWAAAFLGFAFVSATLLFCGVMWKRALDVDVLTEMSRVTAWLIGTWLAFRLVDLTIRGQIVSAFRLDIFALLFWLELAVLGAALWKLRDSVLKRSPRIMFYGALLAVLGGMLYRFDPTTTAFQPKPGAIYFPSVIELLISLGFMAMGVAIFILLAKILPILPGSISLAQESEVQRLKEARLQPLAVRSGAGHFVAGD
jgi:Ni/Fe-hydrogenase subunit HybB-like protein